MTLYVEALSKYRDAGEQVRRVGEYPSLDEAVAASKRVIDEFLQREFKAGVSARQLYKQYEDFGEVPCIFRDDGMTMNIPGFNHRQYATARCAELCGE